jgi:hypothetical protein
MTALILQEMFRTGRQVQTPPAVIVPSDDAEQLTVLREANSGTRALTNEPLINANIKIRSAPNPPEIVIQTYINANPTFADIQQQNTRDIIVSRAQNCKVKCQCILSHDDQSMFHSGNNYVMSEIIPAICTDHLLTVFGLEEYDEEIKYFDEKCGEKTYVMRKLKCRKLGDDKYAFEKDEIIFPSLSPSQVINLFKTQNLHEKNIQVLVENQKMSHHVVNFLKNCMINNRKVNICEFPTNPRTCDDVKARNLCAMYVLLTYNFKERNFVSDVEIRELGYQAAQACNIFISILNECYNKIKMRKIKDLNIVFDAPNDNNVNIEDGLQIFLYATRLSDNNVNDGSLKNMNFGTMGTTTLENVIYAMTNICDHEDLFFAQNVSKQSKNYMQYIASVGQDNAILVTRPPLRSEPNPSGKPNSTYLTNFSERSGYYVNFIPNLLSTFNACKTNKFE